MKIPFSWDLFGPVHLIARKALWGALKRLYQEKTIYYL